MRLRHFSDVNGTDVMVNLFGVRAISVMAKADAPDGVDLMTVRITYLDKSYSVHEVDADGYAQVMEMRES